MQKEESRERWAYFERTEWDRYGRMCFFENQSPKKINQLLSTVDTALVAVSDEKVNGSDSELGKVCERINGEENGAGQE